MKYEKHIFVCTNERRPEQRKSCGEVCGSDIVKEFKKQIQEKNISFPVRAQRAGCMDVCEKGPTVVVYPEGVFYGGVSVADVAEIVEEHIKNNRPVERLIMD